MSERTRAPLSVPGIWYTLVTVPKLLKVGWAIGAGVVPNGGIGSVGAGVVECVKRLCPELELQPLPDGEVLEQGNVLVGESRTVQGIPGRVAEGILRMCALMFAGSA